MNTILIVGNVCNDPKTYTGASGVKRADFRVAVKRKYGGSDGERKTDFFTVVAWRASADFVERNIKKGMSVAVSGAMENRSYEKDDGEKRFIWELDSDEIKICGQR